MPVSRVDKKVAKQRRKRSLGANNTSFTGSLQHEDMDAFKDFANLCNQSVSYLARYAIKQTLLCEPIAPNIFKHELSAPNLRGKKFPFTVILTPDVMDSFRDFCYLVELPMNTVLTCSLLRFIEHQTTDIYASSADVSREESHGFFYLP